MAIKTIDSSMFDKLVKVESIQQEECLSADDTQYLYDKAIEELEVLEVLTSEFKSCLLNLFCGLEILSTDEAGMFFCAMEMFTKELIPSMLKGDHNTTYQYCSEELTGEDLDTARAEFFETLYKKYLEK